MQPSNLSTLHSLLCTLPSFRLRRVGGTKAEAEAEARLRTRGTEEVVVSGYCFRAQRETPCYLVDVRR